MKVMANTDSISKDPSGGACGSIGSFLIGMIPHVDQSTQNDLIFWFQMVAFSVSITVGIITIIWYIIKFKRDKR